MTNEKIWIAGHNGMVGSAVKKFLISKSRNIVTVDRSTLDLRRQEDVEHWLRENRPTSIIFAAAKVGGILANSLYPAEFIYDNLTIQNNIINGAHNANIDRLVFLGSSCIYPKYSAQPIKEKALLTGQLEPSNQWYAVAKIAGLMMCQAYSRQYDRNYISLMPCNLYGPNDNFDLETSHVLPALIRKIHEAKNKSSKEFIVWGSGEPLREFLHVDDLASGVIFCLDNYYSDEPINIGSSHEISIKDLAMEISRVIEYDGKIIFDPTKPDGTPRKVMDSSKLKNLGWCPTIPLHEGIKMTYEWFLTSGIQRAFNDHQEKLLI